MLKTLLAKVLKLYTVQESTVKTRENKSVRPLSARYVNGELEVNGKAPSKRFTTKTGNL